MRNNFFLFFILCSLLALISLHLLALTLYFYWDFWWFDILMHALGGIFTALLALEIYFRFSKVGIVDTQNLKILFIAVLFSLCVGIGWEVYELKTGFTTIGSALYVFDTVSDILMDIVGGLIAYLYFSSRWKQKN